MTTELGETTVHTATDPGNNTLRLPISATFVRAIDQAGVKRGDVFAVHRWEDVIKKSGKGKGQTMPVYSVKVITRAAIAS
jgi:DNA helicase TIP49 (TBP-interacting protein)